MNALPERELNNGADERAAQTTLLQATPTLPRRLCASFLQTLATPSVCASVFKWLASVDPGRTGHCRSKSASPATSAVWDTECFVIPPTPASTGGVRSNPGTQQTGSVAASDTSSHRSSAESLVQYPLYRQLNLAANNIYYRPLRGQLPGPIADLISHVRRGRDSPGPSTDEVLHDASLNELCMGADAPTVEDYFRDKIFPECRPGDVLTRSDRQPMARHTVPTAGSNLKVSNPVPDMLYGYSRHAAFPRQQSQLISMGAEVAANSLDLLYPFLVIEFKGDGPSGAGSLWVATNQCLGGSTACVNIAERLNRQLGRCKRGGIRPMDSAAYSIAMSGTEARLYISWKHDELRYHMANVDSFLLHRPEQYLEFRKYVRNIINWGKGKRLDKIRSSLDALLEGGSRRLRLPDQPRGWIG